MKKSIIHKQLVKKNWYCVDATNKILGRLSSSIASYLRGKNKPEYSRNLDNGDYIIVINAKKILVTGKKQNDKIYYHHTGYIGGIKKIKFQDMLSIYPERIIYLAVKGMLPKGILGRNMLKKLKIFSTENHNHQSQNPIFLKI